MNGQRPSENDRRLLVVVPHLPAGPRDADLRRLLTELARGWRLDLIPAGPSSAERAAVEALGTDASLAAAPCNEALMVRCRHAIALRSYAAVVVVDDASTRWSLDALRRRARKPVVLVLLRDGARPERPRAPLSGDGFSERRRAREDASRQACAASEVWVFGPGASCDRPGFARQQRCEERWMTKRLLELGKPARPELTSIIVPCFNNLRYTRECLEAVARHTREPHEVIVIDNGSSDGTAAYAKRAGARVIRNDTNLGFVRAINQGMLAARGRYVVWLNNDVVVTPGWLGRMIRCAERAPWIAAVGPCTDRTVGEQRVDAPAFKKPRDLEVFAQAWALDREGQAEGVHRLTGFCLLLKREAVERVGLLDERFGIGTYEEFDYCLRLRQAGYDLAVARDVFVRHHGHKSFEGFERMQDRSRVNREIFVDKWCQEALRFLDEIHPAAAATS